MYCKYCGNQIPDNSVFCSKCGKLVVESTTIYSEKSEVNEPKWISTSNMQWRKPIIARVVQIAILIIFGLFSLYFLWCILTGGKVIKYQTGTRYNKCYEYHIKDPLKLSILKFASINERRCHIDYVEYYKNIFRWRMFFIFLPFYIIILLTIRWMKWTRFPKEKDIIPRDVADEIEPYEWYGFTRHKYVFYKKNGKYGVIDVHNYCVSIPAQYEFIMWRIPNKTIDVIIGKETQTVDVSRTIANNQNE